MCRARIALPKNATGRDKTPAYSIRGLDTQRALTRKERLIGYAVREKLTGVRNEMPRLPQNERIIMGLLGKLLKTGIHIATIPLSIAEDVVTLGGAITETDPAVVRKARQLRDDAEDITDEVEKLGD